MIKDVRYPIGKYEAQPFSEALQQEWLLDIQSLPILIESAVLNLDELQLNTPYREGGWTVQQVVHHVADSHMNAYTRFKLAFTENNPVIKPYDEVKWADLKDVEELPVNISITLLHALHKRLHTFLQSLAAADWEKTFFHPEHKKQFTLWYLLGMYAWHGKHHTAHITSLREKMNW